jgi:hypothetical protein
MRVESVLNVGDLNYGSLLQKINSFLVDIQQNAGSVLIKEILFQKT